MNKVIFFFCVILLVVFLFSFKGQERVFRIRVVANSDSAEDQSAKMRVVDKLYELFEKENFSSVEEAAFCIGQMLDTVEEISSTTSGQRATAGIIEEKYQDGEYTSLVVTLGDGKGHNFWGTLFPDIVRRASSAGEEGKKFGVVLRKGEIVDVRIWIFEQFLKIF